jgi:hypothetical protein
MENIYDNQTHDKFVVDYDSTGDSMKEIERLRIQERNDIIDNIIEDND